MTVPPPAAKPRHALAIAFAAAAVHSGAVAGLAHYGLDIAALPATGAGLATTFGGAVGAYVPAKLGEPGASPLPAILGYVIGAAAGFVLVLAK